MEAKESMTSRQPQPAVELHLLLSHQDRLGIRVLSLDAVRVVSVDRAIDVIDQQDLQLLRNLIRANVPLLLVGDGALRQLSSEDVLSNEESAKQTANRRAVHRSITPLQAPEVADEPSAPDQPFTSGLRANHSLQTALAPRARTSGRIKRAIDYMQGHLEEHISLRDVSREACLSQCYFCRLFKKELGTTYSKYLATMRVERATRMLMDPDLSVTEICYRVGFNDLTHFERVFRGLTGLTPSRFRAQIA